MLAHYITVFRALLIGLAVLLVVVALIMDRRFHSMQPEDILEDDDLLNSINAIGHTTKSDIFEPVTIPVPSIVLFKKVLWVAQTQDGIIWKWRPNKNDIIRTILGYNEDFVKRTFVVADTRDDKVNLDDDEGIIYMKCDKHTEKKGECPSKFEISISPVSFLLHKGMMCELTVAATKYKCGQHFGVKAGQFRGEIRSVIGSQQPRNSQFTQVAQHPFDRNSNNANIPGHGQAKTMRYEMTKTKYLHKDLFHSIRLHILAHKSDPVYMKIDEPFRGEFHGLTPSPAFAVSHFNESMARIASKCGQFDEPAMGLDSTVKFVFDYKDPVTGITTEMLCTLLVCGSPAKKETMIVFMLFTPHRHYSIFYKHFSYFVDFIIHVTGKRPVFRLVRSDCAPFWKGMCLILNGYDYKEYLFRCFIFMEGFEAAICMDEQKQLISQCVSMIDAENKDDGDINMDVVLNNEIAMAPDTIDTRAHNDIIINDKNEMDIDEINEIDSDQQNEIDINQNNEPNEIATAKTAEKTSAEIFIEHEKDNLPDSRFLHCKRHVNGDIAGHFEYHDKKLPKKCELKTNLISLSIKIMEEIRVTNRFSTVRNDYKFYNVICRLNAFDVTKTMDVTDICISWRELLDLPYEPTDNDTTCLDFQHDDTTKTYVCILFDKTIGINTTNQTLSLPEFNIVCSIKDISDLTAISNPMKHLPAATYMNKHKFVNIPLQSHIIVGDEIETETDQLTEGRINLLKHYDFPITRRLDETLFEIAKKHKLKQDRWLTELSIHWNKKAKKQRKNNKDTVTKLKRDRAERKLYQLFADCVQFCWSYDRKRIVTYFETWNNTLAQKYDIKFKVGHVTALFQSNKLPKGLIWREAVKTFLQYELANNFEQTNNNNTNNIK